jgi:hypothetical protein
VKVQQVVSWLLIPLVVVLPVMTTGCNAATDVQKVIDSLPVAADIAESVIAIYAAFDPSGADPALAQQVTTITGQVASDLKLLQQLMQQYANDPKSASSSLITRIDAVVADVRSNLSSLLNAFHVTNAGTVAAVTVSVTAVEAVLVDLSSLLTTAQAPNAPHVADLAKSHGIVIGAALPEGQHRNIRTAKAVAQDYNSKLPQEFQKAKVRVP